MKIIGLGVDIVENRRLADSIRRYGEAFLERVFLQSEREYCGKMAMPERCYGARFAAKEAVAKAMGTGFGKELGWRDIEIVRLGSGAPAVVLHGAGAATARRLGIGEWKISLSHSDDYATATALALGLEE